MTELLAENDSFGPSAESAAPRPRLLILVWFLVSYPASLAVSWLYALFLPFNFYWLVWGLETALASMHIGVVYWMVMLRPHSKLSLTIPTLLMLVPGVLLLSLMMMTPGLNEEITIGNNRTTTIWASQVARFSNHWIELTCCGCVVYLFSLATGLQLVRGNQAPQPGRIKIVSLLLVTTLIAASFATTQLIPTATNPNGQGIGSYYGALLGLQYGAAWILLSWASWKTTSMRVYIACGLSLAIISACRAWNVWRFSKTVGSDFELDAFTFAMIVFCGICSCLAIWWALWFLRWCGYPIARSQQILAGHDQDLSAPSPVSPFAAGKYDP